VNSLLRTGLVLLLLWPCSVCCFCANKGVVDTPAPAKIPQAKVLHIKTPVTIDGIIDAAWSHSPALILTANYGPGAGSEVSLHSEARVMCDKINLYVLFVFEDPSVTFAYVNPDDILWDSGEKLDLAELILQPGTNSQVYYEFAVNPAGALLDSQVKWKRGQPTWNISWPDTHPQVAAGRLSKDVNGIDGWCVEMAIPFDSIDFKPNKGTIMKANFHRADVDLPGKWLSWSPTLSRSIHVPSKFGCLFF